MCRITQRLLVIPLLLVGTVAAETVVYTDNAGVVAVEPVLETRLEPVRERYCEPPPLLPPAASLGADIRRQQRLLDAAPDCGWVERREPVRRITGYRVTYRYQGRDYTRIMDRPPGEYVPVRVALDPLR